LLGKEIATQLKVPSLDDEAGVNVFKQEGIFQKYKLCFEDLGKLKNVQLDIPIDKDVKPVAQQMCRVTFSWRDKLEQKLNELVDLDVFERAEGPAPWISPDVVVSKPNGDLHLCVAMRQGNGAIREGHRIPIIDEILHD